GPGLNAAAWLTAATVIVRVCGALVTAPPPNVPRLSCSLTVTVATPFAFDASVNVSVPAGDTAGWTENRAVLVLETMKSSACAASSAGPGLMAVAQVIDCADASSSTVTFAPFV